jgi:hypothetical protein
MPHQGMRLITSTPATIMVASASAVAEGMSTYPGLPASAGSGPASCSGSSDRASRHT